MMDLSKHIGEFLRRYDSCLHAGDTPPQIWLAEAATLLRAVAQERRERPGPEVQDFYFSSNGDRWRLIGDPAGQAVVRHEPNAGSGGAASEMPLAAFLDCPGGSPEHAALRQLLDARKAGR